MTEGEIQRVVTALEKLNDKLADLREDIARIDERAEQRAKGTAQIVADLSAVRDQIHLLPCDTQASMMSKLQAASAEHGEKLAAVQSTLDGITVLQGRSGVGMAGAAGTATVISGIVYGILTAVVAFFSGGGAAK